MTKTDNLLHRARCTLVGSKLACLAIVLATACAEAPTRSQPRAPTPQALVWPKPPAAPRIRFVRNITSPADWGVAKGAPRRFLDRLTGETPFKFVRPTSVAARNGTLYVADAGAQALIVFDPSRPRELKIERVGSQVLMSPVAVALGPHNTIYLADSALRQVFVLDAEGRLLRSIGGEGRLSRPAGLAYDGAADRLYVADSVGHRVIVFSGDGKLLQTIGSNGTEPGEFNFPSHVGLTPDGRLLVSDSLNYRIQVLTSDGQPLRHFGRAGDGSGDFAAPKGVGADKAGNIYVVDALFDAVQLFTPDGTLLLGFGERGTQPGRLWLPNGLFIDSHDIIYVADSYNQRIAMFQRIDGAGADPQ